MKENENMNVLLVGPSLTKSKGGMTAVISGIISDEILQKDYRIDSFASTIDGNIIAKLIYSFVALFKFLHVVKKYDVIHINVASRGSSFRKALYVKASKKRKKKVILHVHGGLYLDFYDNLSGLRKKTIDKMWSNSDVVIALSEDWKKEYQKRFANSKIVVIENGVDTEKYNRARNNLLDYKDTVLFLGRIVKEKGVYELVDAIRIIADEGRDIKLFIVGPGESEKLRDYISKMKVTSEIQVLDWADEDKKIKLLSICAIVVLPSYTEALPMSILEAMAAGKAIVATKVGAIPDLIKSKNNGELIDPMDARQLASAVIKVQENIENEILTGKENQRLVEERYSCHRMHSLIANVYASICS